MMVYHKKTHKSKPGINVSENHQKEVMSCKLCDFQTNFEKAFHLHNQAQKQRKVGMPKNFECEYCSFKSCSKKFKYIHIVKNHINIKIERSEAKRKEVSYEYFEVDDIKEEKIDYLSNLEIKNEKETIEYSDIIS